MLELCFPYSSGITCVRNPEKRIVRCFPELADEVIIKFFMDRNFFGKTFLKSTLDGRCHPFDISKVTIYRYEVLEVTLQYVALE